MNEAQTKLHWNNSLGWGAVCLANYWRMEEGQMIPQAFDSRDRSDWHKKVWALAKLIARQAGRAVKPDDLRKGAYMLALVKVKSSIKFDNRDLDRVLNVFALLIEPLNLDAVKKWNAYQRGGDPGGHKRLIVGIEMKAPEAYIAAISRDKFGTADWRSLNGQQLFRLNMTLANRAAQWRKPAKKKQEPVSANYPF